LHEEIKMPAIELSHISKSFGTLKAVDDVEQRKVGDKKIRDL
jgi:ABC-type branched-subunit amino acid transport system ATPase component